MPLYDARRITYCHDSFGLKPSVGGGSALDAGGTNGAPSPQPPASIHDKLKPQSHRSTRAKLAKAAR